MGRKRVPDQERKEKISLYINANLIKDMKEKKINISQLAEKLLLLHFSKK